jgi:hypothetical protein
MDGIFCEPCLKLNRAKKGIECQMNGFIQAHPAFYYQKKQRER